MGRTASKVAATCMSCHISDWEITAGVYGCDHIHLNVGSLYCRPCVLQRYGRSCYKWYSSIDEVPHHIL